MLDEPSPARVVELVGPAGGNGAETVVVALNDRSELERSRLVIDELSLGIAFVDREHNMTWRHRRRDEGALAESSVGESVLTRIHPDDHDMCVAVLDELADEPGARRQMVLRIRPPEVTGSWFPLRVTVWSLYDEALVGGVLSAWEPSGAVVASAGDDGHSTISWHVVEATSEGVAVFDPSGQLRFRNQRVMRLLGEEAGLGGIDTVVRAFDDRGRSEVEGVIAAGFEGIGGQVVARTDAALGGRWLRVTSVPDIDAADLQVGVVLTAQDITEEVHATEALRAARDELWHLAHHDQLTGLGNRALLVERLTLALEERASAEVGQPVGASVGVAVGEPGDDPRRLLHRVDQAMYAVKTTRRRRRTD